MTNKSPNSEQDHKFTNRSLLKVIFAAVCILGLIYYSYLYYSIRDINKLLQTHNNDLGRLNSLTTEIEQVKATLANNQNEFTRLNQALGTVVDVQNQPHIHVELLNLKNLVNFALVKLIDKDIDSALAILNIAEQNLRVSNKTEFQDIRKSLLVKIEHLKQINQPDIVKIKAFLQEYSNNIEQLSLLDFVSAKKVEAITSDLTNSTMCNTQEQGSMWHRFVVNLQSNFFELVKIRNIKGSDLSFAKLQTEEQINLLKTFLKLKISELSINLQQHNQKLFSANLADLMHNTELYFSNNPVLKNNLLSLLNNAKAVDINPALPDLSSLTDEIDNFSKNRKDIQNKPQVP